MEQSSTTKIVSLHMEPCSYDCPNVDVCYHRKKSTFSGKTEEVLPLNFREQMLDKGYIVHESKCTQLAYWHETLLKLYPNYNITIPYSLFEKSKQNGIIIPIKQVQITVYTKEQARKVLNYQKLFLVKNDETLQYAIKEGLWTIPYSYMHFCVNQDWVTSTKLQELFYYKMLSNTIGTTVDSCAESWIINGGCPYNHGSYVDITYDGTLRACPFNKSGVPINEVYNGDYGSLFTLQCTPEKCKYSEIFNGEVNGTNKHTSL